MNPEDQCFSTFLRRDGDRLQRCLDKLEPRTHQRSDAHSFRTQWWPTHIICCSLRCDCWCTTMENHRLCSPSDPEHRRGPGWATSPATSYPPQLINTWKRCLEFLLGNAILEWESQKLVVEDIAMVHLQSHLPGIVRRSVDLLIAG